MPLLGIDAIHDSNDALVDRHEGLVQCHGRFATTLVEHEFTRSSHLRGIGGHQRVALLGAARSSGCTISIGTPRSPS